MNIHVFINCYWGPGISGGDRRALEILKRWKNTDSYRFIIYTTSRFYELMQQENITHLEVVLTDTNEKREKGLIRAYMRRTIQCIKALKRNLQPGDVLYSTTDILPDVVPPAYFKLKQKAKYRWSMITFHIFEIFYKRPGNVLVNFLSCYQQKYAMHLGNKYADTYMTTSPLVQQYMQQHRYYMDKVTLIDNAVDTEIIDNSNLNIQGYDACFLARLNYSKGILELPIIWKKVIQKYPDARLAIMGKGSDEIVNELQECIRENQVEKSIDIMGYVESEKAYSIMKASKLFLFTSHEEGWGMALAEALVCGIPAVAYNLPIFKYLFKEGVVLCELKDTSSMADKVCSILENEEKGKKMGLAGREYILRHYSLDKVAEKELQIILGK